MKRNLDTGVEVDNNEVKENQRHTTNEKPNMYISIFNKKKPIFLFTKQIFMRVITKINSKGESNCMKKKTREEKFGIQVEESEGYNSKRQIWERVFTPWKHPA